MTSWFYASAATSLIFQFLISIGFVVVSIMTRRTRPQAFVYLMSASILGIVVNIISPVFYAVVLPMITMRFGGGVDGIGQAQFFSSLMFNILHVCNAVLLLIGILRLAKDPPQPFQHFAPYMSDPNAPYLPQAPGGF